MSSSTHSPVIVGSVAKMKPVTLPPAARSSRRSRCRSGRQRARKRWEWCAFSEAAPLWWVWCSKEGDQAIARRVPSRNVASTSRRQVAQRIGVELEARGQMLSTINSTNPTPTNSTASATGSYSGQCRYSESMTLIPIRTPGSQKTPPFVRAGRSMR